MSKLLTKGVDKKRIQKIFDSLQQKGELGATEEELAYEILRKKHYNPTVADGKIRQKMYNHLAYKGFSAEVINHVLGEFQTDIC